MIACMYAVKFHDYYPFPPSTPSLMEPVTSSGVSVATDTSCESPFVICDCDNSDIILVVIFIYDIWEHGRWYLFIYYKCMQPFPKIVPFLSRLFWSSVATCYCSLQHVDPPLSILGAYVAATEQESGAQRRTGLVLDISPCKGAEADQSPELAISIGSIRRLCVLGALSAACRYEFHALSPGCGSPFVFVLAWNRKDFPFQSMATGLGSVGLGASTAPTSEAGRLVRLSKLPVGEATTLDRVPLRIHLNCEIVVVGDSLDG